MSTAGTVNYRLKQIDFDGTFSYSNIIIAAFDFTPAEYVLYQNYPNPFNPVTSIKFSVPYESNVRISVYNVLGQKTAVLLDDVKNIGQHEISWNASGSSSGIYYYSIDATSLDGKNSFNSIKKMVLVK
jgi:hypothetical protein